MFSGRNSGRSIALLTALVLVVFLVAPLIVNVHAATSIVFDAKSTATPCVSSCSAPLSWSHTVGSGVNGILIVSIFIGVLPTASLKPVSSIKYGTSALTFIGSHVIAASGSEIEMWSVLNPPAGSALVTVTWTGTNDVVFAGSVSYFNVGGTHAFSGADGGSGTLPSLTVNANSGDLVVDAVVTGVLQPHAAFTVSPGSLQTQRWDSGATVSSQQMGTEDITMGGSDQPASSSVTMTWATSTVTLVGWIQVAVALTPPAVVPEYPLGLPLLAVFMIVGYGLIRRRTKVQ
jgi:hypothetical protein